MEVQFDTHGIGNCPKGRIVGFDDCRQCPDYLGYTGFTVYCKTQVLPTVCRDCLDQKCLTGSLCLEIGGNDGDLSEL